MILPRKISLEIYINNFTMMKKGRSFLMHTNTQCVSK